MAKGNLDATDRRFQFGRNRQQGFQILLVGTAAFLKRVGVIAEEIAEVLDTKIRGDIRGVVSSSSQLSQALVERALAADTIDAERTEKRELLHARAERVHVVAQDPRFADAWEMYPFNSGYFMLIKVQGVDANELRVHLLDQHQVGLISTSATDLRIAFSCLEVDQVQPMFETIHRAIGELRGD